VGSIPITRSTSPEPAQQLNPADYLNPADPSAATTPPAASRGVFDIRPDWAGRAKALGLAMAWVVLWVGLFLATSYGLVFVGLLPADTLRAAHPADITPGQIELAHVALAVVTVATTLIMVSLTREKLTRFGFAPLGAGRDFSIGLASGLLLMPVTLGLMAALGGFRFGAVALPLGRIVLEAPKYAVIFLLVAVAEELWFRSFTLVQLSRALSFWPAAILMSALFLLSHTANVGENPLGLLAAALVGLVLAWSFRRTGALWFAIGFHTSWDYAESFLFGVPDSGGVLPNALTRPSMHGADWLTGGSAGPEGSLLVYPALLLLALVVRFVLPRRAT
jgi:uncharacterized protein